MVKRRSERSDHYEGDSKQNIVIDIRYSIAHKITNQANNNRPRRVTDSVIDNELFTVHIGDASSSWSEGSDNRYEVG